MITQEEFDKAVDVIVNGIRSKQIVKPSVKTSNQPLTIIAVTNKGAFPLIDDDESGYENPWVKIDYNYKLNIVDKKEALKEHLIELRRKFNEKVELHTEVFKEADELRKEIKELEKRIRKKN